jgi:hypothetical protein
MPVFKVGDHVRWINAVSIPELKNAVGVVESVIPNDTQVDEFTMYEIEFEFGPRTLYGTQIRAA